MRCCIFRWQQLESHRVGQSCRGTDMGKGMYWQQTLFFIIKIQTPLKIAVIILEFQQCGFTVLECIQKCRLNGKQCRPDQTVFTVCSDLSVKKLRIMMLHLFDVYVSTVLYMSRAMRKRVLCHMRTTKAQIGLSIRTIWWVPLLFTA